MATTLERLRSRPGMSNAGKYPGEKHAGPNGTYPLTKGGKPDLSRIKAADRLAGHSNQPSAIRKKVANYAVRQGNAAMKSFGKQLLQRMSKKRNAYGGNKGDESSSERDYPNAKLGADQGYKAKKFGSKAGERSKSRRDYTK